MTFEVLPPLRQELSLQPAPAAIDGSPTWTLHDPADNRFFEIGWPAFEMLARWSLGNAEAVAEAVNAETTLDIDASEVQALAQFLVSQHLTLAAGRETTAFLMQSVGRRKLSLPKWLLKNYLFVRFPLVRPMPFLRRVYPGIRGVYTPTFWWLVLAVTLTGLYFVSQQWDSFVHTFHTYTSWQGLLGLAVALSIAKVLHELGHAFTAYRYGCRIPTMGVALLVMWPVLYTDTNESWKLASRRQRLHIGAAGMLAELMLAAFATLLWNFLPDGPVRAGVFMLATSTWVVTLTINASPFTRFDGYYLLSDWLNMPNLHARAFALGRWWLRERLFGYGDPPPEVLPPKRRRQVVLLAFVTWIYRFVLFLSIALLVFHVFFRALGMVLMAVEIGWFLALPIVRECLVWWQRREELRWNRAIARTGMIVLALLLWLLVPWQSSVHAPAVLGDVRSQRIYVPHAARVESIRVATGQRVRAGDVLAQLASPELEYQLQRAAEKVKVLKWQVAQQPFDEDLKALGPALGKRLANAREDVNRYEAQIARLTLAAPFAGKVVDVNSRVQVGAWVQRATPMFELVSPGAVKGDAFVGEDDVSRVQQGQRVTFVNDLASASALHCKVTAVDGLNLSALDEPYVASVYGGDIPSVRGKDGVIRALEPVFRVRFGQCGGSANLSREQTGRAIIDSASQSLLDRISRRFWALVHREAGF